MTRAQALAWVSEQDEDGELDSDELDAACRALGYDPAYLAGDDEDPIDRRWDVVCAEVQS